MTSIMTGFSRELDVIADTDGALCKWEFLAACRPGFLFEMLGRDGDGRIARKEYDDFRLIGADDWLLTKEEWDAGLDLLDPDLHGLLSREKMGRAWFHLKRPGLVEASPEAAAFVVKVFAL